MNKKAVILFSGGMDSTTCLAIAKKQNFKIYAISFDYGQKHRSELDAAKKIASQLGVVEHKIILLPLHNLVDSALLNSEIAIPDFTNDKKIPSTYVPARNTIFLSIALGYAEIIEAQDIFIGVSCIDYSGYVDCRPEYITAYEKMANLAIKTAVEGKKITIHTPLSTLSKAETIKIGNQLGIDYFQTITCYRANTQGYACGTCASCVLRKKGFVDANLPDATFYVD